MPLFLESLRAPWLLWQSTAFRTITSSCSYDVKATSGKAHLQQFNFRRHVQISFTQDRTMSLSPPYKKIDPDHLIEEETRDGYDSKHFYPVRIGQIFDGRYKVIGKLGFGSASTVWLCRDQQKQHDFVALKVYINNLKYYRELPIYDHIHELKSEHSGGNHVRKLYDSFEAEGPDGMHICLVQQALGPTFQEMKDYGESEVFSSQLSRTLMRFILCALQFLHKEARIVHTGK